MSIISAVILEFSIANLWAPVTTSGQREQDKETAIFKFTCLFTEFIFVFKSAEISWPGPAILYSARINEFISKFYSKNRHMLWKFQIAKSLGSPAKDLEWAEFH